MINAPVGFRFSPTNEELARYYLANRVAGNLEDLWRGLINEFDMYTEEPEQLWGRFYGPNLGGNNLVEAKSDKYIYLFTTLKKVSSDGNGKKVNRRVGKTGGTWHGQNVKKYWGEGGFSWYERHFSYKNDKRKDQECVWLMTELCLHEDDNLVLCRIGKKPLRVDDDNVMVQGTKAKRTRTEGTFRGSGISIGREQVQPHGGVGCGFGNQRSENMGVPYHHGIDQDQGGNALFNPTIDQNQGGDGTIFNPIRTCEVGAMHMGSPYHHGTEFDSSNLRIDGSFPSTWMENMNMIQMGVEANINSTLDPVLIESGLLAPKSIRVHENLNHEEIGNGIYATMNPNTRMQEEVEADMGINGFDDLDGNPVVKGDTPISCNIREPDHEDNVDILDVVDIVVGDMDELEEAMRATYPEYYNNITDGPITRIQEEEEEDKGVGTNYDNDINLPGSTDWFDLDQCMINSLDEWIAELQRGGEKSPVQQMPRP